jgi:hypothetical protein
VKSKERRVARNRTWGVVPRYDANVWSPSVENDAVVVKLEFCSSSTGNTGKTKEDTNESEWFEFNSIREGNEWECFEGDWEFEDVVLVMLEWLDPKRFPIASKMKGMLGNIVENENVEEKLAEKELLVKDIWEVWVM